MAAHTTTSIDPFQVLISEGLTEYFQHYAHREQRTNEEKHVLGFQRFLEIIDGDRPIQEARRAPS